MTEKAINNRYEIVFIYDVRDANPNGDPDNSNMPRFDDRTGENVVTDVRLKRTIRDFWIAKGQNVLVKAETDDDGTRKSMEKLALDFLGIAKVEKSKAGEIRAKLANDLPKKCLDVRSFGAAITLTGANFSHVGTVQFGLGRSMNKPSIQSKTITTSFSAGSGDDKKSAGTFGEYHTIDYSLIRFHGIVNEINAKAVSFSDDDLNLLYQGLWLGTKQLNTRSKFNHLPRILISVVTKEGSPQIGDLDICLCCESGSNPKSIDEAKVDITEFIKRIKLSKDMIEKIQYLYDSELNLIYEGAAIASLDDAIKKAGLSIPLQKINGV